MTDRGAVRLLRAATIATAALALVAGPAVAKSPARTTASRTAKKTPQPLTGSLGSGATFPARSLVLFPPSHLQPSAGQIHVSENGGPVGDLSVTPLTTPNPGDFGVVLVIDQSTSMSGAPLASAMAGARALAAQRTGNQQLGAITFDATPSITLPLTSNPTTIRHALAATPWTAPGAQVMPAMTLALHELAQAKVAAGAVILVSGGPVTGAAGQPSPQAIAAAAQAAGVRIFTVQLRGSQPASSLLSQLAHDGGGTFTQSTGAQVNQAVTNSFSKQTSGDLVRYRSLQRPGSQVTVTAQVTGAPGSVSSSYHAPALPPPKIPPHRAAPRPVPHPRHAAAAPRQAISRLTPRPSWAPAPHRTPFWNSSLSLLLVAVACALLTGIAVLLLVLDRSARRLVQARVASFIEAPDPSSEESAALAGEVDAPRFLLRRRWWPGFVEAVQVARWQRSPPELVKLALWGSVAAVVLLMVLTGSIFLAVLGLPLGPLVLRLAVRRAAKRQRARFRDQLPSHLQDLSGAMRAGRSIVGAMSAVAETADEPIRGEFERALADEALGMPFDEALEAIAMRMNADDMGQVALIASLHRRTGSNVTEALDRVAEGSRDRGDLQREMKGLTAQARISSWVLSGLPPMFLLVISLLDPGYARPMFHTVGGIVALVFSAILVLMGWLAMKRIVNVEA